MKTILSRTIEDAMSCGRLSIPHDSHTRLSHTKKRFNFSCSFSFNSSHSITGKRYSCSYCFSGRMNHSITSTRQIFTRIKMSRAK